MSTSPYYVNNGDVSSGISLGPDDLMYVNSGGTTTRIENEGGIHVSSGGQVERTIVFNKGWMILSSGNGIKTTLRDGGRETILDGGETDAIVLSGGSMYVSNGVCLFPTVSGGLIDCSVSGVVRSATVTDGGRIDVNAGGKALVCQVANGGVYVSSGGVARRITALSDALVEVHSGGKVSSVCVGDSSTTEPPAAGIPNAVMEISSGGSAFLTSVYMGGMVSFEHSDALCGKTYVYGGSISGNDLILSSGCSVLFEDGGAATLSTLTIQSGGLMRVDSGTTVQFQNIVLDENPNGFTMKDLATCDPASGTFRKLLDWTAGTTEVWTEARYRELLNITDEALFSSSFLYQNGDLYLRGAAQVFCGGTDEPFPTVQAALATSPSAVVVRDGEFAAASNTPTFEGVTTTIYGGVFTTSVCGGYLYQEPATPPEDFETVEVGEAGDKRNISLTINGGEFNKIVFAGDRVNRELLTQTRTGDISLTINGGEFNNAVAGAMAFTGMQSNARLVGNVSLTITGGTFNNINNKGWIYGGSIATQKALGANTVIKGNVTVTLDSNSAADGLLIQNLVAGSYGAGKISGDTRLVLTGTHNITAAGEIWGGCSSDVILCTYIGDSGNREVTSQVEGNRILSFTGFSGTLASEANRIRAFNCIELKGNSDAAVANSGSGSVNFSDVVNWTFENGSKLTGNFINDFNGDTLDLKGFTTGGTFELMTDTSLSSNDIFNEFDKLADIRMNGDSVGLTPSSYSYDDENKLMKWSWSAGSSGSGETLRSWLGGSLIVDKKYGTMKLTTLA